MNTVAGGAGEKVVPLAANEQLIRHLHIRESEASFQVHAHRVGTAYLGRWMTFITEADDSIDEFLSVHLSLTVSVVAAQTVFLAQHGKVGIVSLYPPH